MTAEIEGAEPRTPPPALVERRILDGPNPWFPRPAIKATMRPCVLLEAHPDDAARLARALEMNEPVYPGEPASELRVRFCARVLASLVRAVARRSGLRRLAVRSRPRPASDEIVVVFPWRRLGRAEALVVEVAVLADTLLGADVDVAAALARAGAAVASAPDGEHPDVPEPTVPVVGVTGTNGKTTVARLVAHLASASGHKVAWTTSDGVYVDGTVVEEGDLTGFVGARTALRAPGISFAVLEVARGGILRRGIGTSRVDVSVVTNIQADHLGVGGVETLEQLAEVKGALVRITSPDGTVVVNADDPRAFAMRHLTDAAPAAFSLDPDSPGLRVVLDEGGFIVTVVDDLITVQQRAGGAEPLVPVTDAPMTIGGVSPHNIANVLAATAAAIASGIGRDAIIAGLQSFRPDPELNPGRMNIFDVRGSTVIVDYGHNEDGLRALLHVARRLVAPDAAVRLVLNAVGDRSDDILRGMGEAAGRGADHVVIAERPSALRGTERDRLYGLLRAGLAEMGHGAVRSEQSEVAATKAVIEAAMPGDVCAVMAHAERTEVIAGLLDAGGRLLSPDEVRSLVPSNGTHAKAP